ncbi:unnamed protein product [Ceutorhynchus assimilis]|uniref:Nuclear hormone receptor HR96 n=1 Tax=Ceutorhynchus assimilis TaxID=467358 RepID=A0A9N9MDV0_9CUCU|nr:unnamed protein product [Ceutorhynchus assimilis]
MKNKVDLKVCGVCGDKALGYNFNAVTCESCKAFFRRNALTQKEFRCPFADDCKITPVTRRFCQKCRLDKCITIGMCKDLIMSEEDKAQKRQKVEENRAKKRSIGGSGSSNKRMKKESSLTDLQDNEMYSSSYNTDSDQDNSVSEGYQLNNPNIVSYNPNQENKNTVNDERIACSDEKPSDDSLTFQNLTQHFYNVNHSNLDPAFLSSFMNSNTVNNNETAVPVPSYNNNNYTASTENRLGEDASSKDVPRDVQSQKSHPYIHPFESILSEAIKLEYDTYSSIAQGSSQSRQLNDAERAKLNELVLANKALLTPVEEELGLLGNELKDVVKNQMSGQNQQQTDPALLDLINLTAVGIRRIIKMAKKINAFKNMCQEDQVALLKGGCTEIMMMISARRYDSTKNSWKIPSIQESLNVNVNVLKLAKGNAYQELERFIRTFDPKWRTDENIILILCAIVLFTPDRPRVIHQDVVKLEQNSYYYLLRRYLESVYAGCEAKSIFLKLMQKIMELHKVNEELINVLLDVNPSQVEPLLIEIFDLK